MFPASPAAAKLDDWRPITAAGITYLICVLAAVGYALTQDIIAFGDGHPFDAAWYVKVASDVSQHQVMSAEKPFVYRILLPYLVGQFFGSNLLHGFLVLNLLAAALTILVLYPLLRVFTANAVAIAVVLLTFVCNPNAPFRFSFFYPALTDSPALLFILLVFVVSTCFPAVTVQRTVTLCVLTIVGVLFREIVLLAPLALLLAAVYRRLAGGSKASGSDLAFVHAIAPVVAGVGALWVTHVLVEPINGEYTFVGHALSTLMRNIGAPSIYPLSALAAYGPLLLVVGIEWKAVARTLGEHPEFAAFLLLLAPLSAIGGYHTDRFFYWAFPAVLPLQAVAIDRLIKRSSGPHRTLLFASIAFCQILAFRVFWQIPNADFDALRVPGHPQYMLFAPYGSDTNFGQIFAAYMGSWSRAILSAEYLILIAWLFLLTRRSRGGVNHE